MKGIKGIVLLAIFLVVCASFKLYEGCNNFDNENACRGNQTDNDASWANRSFQTPPRGDPLWREGYQDYNILVGYAQTTYKPGRTSATVKVMTRVNPKYQGVNLKYFFNEQ